MYCEGSTDYKGLIRERTLPVWKRTLKKYKYYTEFVEYMYEAYKDVKKRNSRSFAVAYMRGYLSTAQGYIDFLRRKHSDKVQEIKTEAETSIIINIRKDYEDN